MKKSTISLNPAAKQKQKGDKADGGTWEAVSTAVSPHTQVHPQGRSAGVRGKTRDQTPACCPTVKSLLSSLPVISTFLVQFHPPPPP